MILLYYLGHRLLSHFNTVYVTESDFWELFQCSYEIFHHHASQYLVSIVIV